MNAATPRNDAVQQLRRLVAEAPLTAEALREALGVSQPTFSRLWKMAGNDIVALGAARATVYGMVRDVGGLGSQFPVYRVSEAGNVEVFGELTALQNGWYAFIQQGSGKPQISEGLPYFMQDMRPQGFLGRLVPIQHEDLKLPTSVTEWSDDDVLVYLLRRGDDATGNLVLGSESYRRLITGEADANSLTVLEADREAQYPTLAVLANRGTIVGSSAGGEQPKFITRVARPSGDIDHVIVKFSATLESASGRRWADLLVCEHLAGQTLQESGIPASRSQILAAEDRIFLEVVRFDRCGQTGRAAMVSMCGLDGLLGMLDKPWSHTANALAGKGLLTNDDLARIRLIDLFGALIGNTDRHPGNLSLSWNDAGTFSLLPVYDMLPMMYRPNTQGEVVDREFDLAVIDKLDTRPLHDAMKLATVFWERVEQDPRISEDFREIARRHAHAMTPKRMTAPPSVVRVDVTPPARKSQP